MAKKVRVDDQEGLVDGANAFSPGIYVRELAVPGGLEGAKAVEEYRTQSSGRDDYACNVEYEDGHLLRKVRQVRPGEYTEGGEDQAMEYIGDYSSGYNLRVFGEQDEQRDGNDAPPTMGWPPR